VGNAPSKEIFTILEEMVIFQAPLEKVYKLMILWSKSAGGIKQTYYDTLSKDIIETYGFSEATVLERMVRENLITVGNSMLKFGASDFIQMTKVKKIIQTIKNFTNSKIKFFL